MSELDEMLRAPPDMALPPQVRFCKDRLAAGDRVELEVIRPDPAGGMSRTELVIRRWTAEQEQQPVALEWDDGVNAGLLDLGIRSIDIQQEGMRFSVMIRAALRKVERRYGDGYLNSVLIELLDESDLSQTGEIAAVRKFVRVNRAEPSSTYKACRELIAGEIGGRAVELREKLRYDVNQVQVIISKALAIYLDDRFSVSSRRHFGLL